MLDAESLQFVAHREPRLTSADHDHTEVLHHLRIVRTRRQRRDRNAWVGGRPTAIEAATPPGYTEGRQTVGGWTLVLSRFQAAAGG